MRTTEAHEYDGDDSDDEKLEGEFSDDDDVRTNPLPPSCFEPPPEEQKETVCPKKKTQLTKKIVTKRDNKSGNIRKKEPTKTQRRQVIKNPVIQRDENLDKFHEEKPITRKSGRKSKKCTWMSDFEC